MTPKIDKKILRQRLLDQRRSMSVLDWRSQSQQICQFLARDHQFRTAKTVLGYFSVQQEPDLSNLWDENHRVSLNQSGHPSFGFPICEGKSLVWRKWHPGEPLVMGKYGIPEPDRSGLMISPEQVDVMLVPCVGADRRGYRLGYGGGFYDRLLANPRWRSVPTIGIVFHFGLLDSLPTETWDLPLDRICSSDGIYIS